MNMQSIMAQAQKMQRDMEKKQQEINTTDYEGTSELVDVIMSGDKKIKSVKIKIDKELDQDDIEILEDMIKISVNDAITKINKDVESKMGTYGKQFGGLF